ncbi:AI-2E family transporter [Candidatus Parcubacteria bacterium]|nr:MAG: AI-2E family transporter [Candidatus Parcubacteria bacterium]
MALERISLDISYTSYIRAVIVVAVTVALVYLSQIIVALLFAMVIASGIEPGVRWFARYRVPRIAAVLLIYVIAIAVLGTALALVLPPLVDEFTAFLDDFPRYQRVLLQELRAFEDLPFYTYFSENAQQFILNPPFDLRTVGSSALDLIVAFFGGIGSALILLVVSFYLASQERGIEQFLRLVTPLRSEEYVIGLWQRTQTKLGRWLRGQLILGLIIGVLVYFTLIILGVPYAFTLALLAAVLELVPIIGPILAAIPAVFFGFLDSPVRGLVVAAAYVLIQQIESHLLVPLVMRQALGLNPLIVIIGLLAGAKLGGIIGMFLAVPLASVIAEFLVDTDRKRREVLADPRLTGQG